MKARCKYPGCQVQVYKRPSRAFRAKTPSKKTRLFERCSRADKGGFFLVKNMATADNCKRKSPADMSAEEAYDWIKSKFDEEAAEKFKGRFNSISIQQQNGAKVLVFVTLKRVFLLKQNKK